MAFPRQLRPALFYYRTSCTYRYDYLSPTDSWLNYNSQQNLWLKNKLNVDLLAHPVSHQVNIIPGMKSLVKVGQMKYFKSSLYVLVSLWDNSARLQPSIHEYR